MAAHWTREEGEVAGLMNKIPKLVFSKTLETADWNNSSIIKENASAEFKKLKAQGGRDMYVFGSANLSETFIIYNLFDENRIGFAPVIMGSGRPLFIEDRSSNK